MNARCHHARKGALGWLFTADFGYGTSHWMWNASHTSPIQFKTAPGRSVSKTPPETDAIISGNVIYDTGRDGILVDGKRQIEPPRYQYAVFVSTGPHSPVGLHFSDNLFDPGTAGICNTDLKPYVRP